MNEFADHTAELYELAHAQCDGELTVAQTARLERLMTDDAELRRRYVVYMHVHAAAERGERGAGNSNEGRVRENGERLEHPSGARSVDSGALSSQHLPVPFPDLSVPHSSFLIQPSSSPPSFFGGALFSYLTAAMLLSTALVIAWAWKLPDYAQVAVQSDPSPSPLPAASSCRMDFVGRITGMVDCEWSDSHTAVPGPVAVPLNRKYALASGLLEITYDSGATVILQGPCTYEVESAHGGYLSVGKLTAKVDKKREGRTKNKGLLASRSSFVIPHSYFAVRTPTAIVTDLGTEFGVEVSEKGNTLSHVFRGSVKLEPIDADGEKEGDSRVLRENESAQVGQSDGQRTIQVVGASAKPVDFAREIPKRTIRSFDLVDVVAGGDGLSGRRNRGIDPATGQISDRSPSTYFPTVAGDYRYHPVDALALVDGVFIPNGERGPVQIDSAGHTFDSFEKTDNLTYGHVWAGGPIAPANAPDAVATNLRGSEDYASSGHGLLLMHANSGITFDLEAIRQATGGKIVRLRTVGGNAATFSDGATVNADLWVLVDGEQRFARRQEAGRGGPVFVSVPLKAGDRFLTLAFTDGGDGCGWDWTILGDPTLDVVVTEPSRESGLQAQQEGQR